jgi:hypothetical protein
MYFCSESMRICDWLFTVKKQKAGLASGLRGDEVYTPSPRRSEGRRDQLGALFEPRRKQNLSANPKRTAKLFIRYNYIDAVIMQMVQNIFFIFLKNVSILLVT